jgi:sporulation protein YqfD
MGIYRSLSGIVCAEVTSADILSCLHLIERNDIEIWDLRNKDTLTVTFVIRSSDYNRLEKILTRRGDTLRIASRLGMFWRLQTLRRRPIFVFGMVIILLLSCYLPSKVLFVRVEGNSNLPANVILEQAAECGIYFGASTRKIRSETVKNQLLSKVNGLQWVGINTYGCVAVISVQERTPEPNQTDKHPVTSIVSKRDAVIMSIIARRGSAVTKVGEAVKSGQLLISGYTDCGIHIRATQADGEVMGLTEHEITVYTPTKYTQRNEILSKFRKYSLIIGKKRINFLKGSGILDATCARIYSEWYITLPGNFVLPFGIIREEYITYSQSADTQKYIDLSSYGKAYTLSSMTAGSILSASEEIVTINGFAVLHGRYACCESLGIIRIEEHIESYG